MKPAFSFFELRKKSKLFPEKRGKDPRWETECTPSQQELVQHIALNPSVGVLPGSSYPGNPILGISPLGFPSPLKVQRLNSLPFRLPADPAQHIRSQFNSVFPYRQASLWRLTAPHLTAGASRRQRTALRSVAL